MPSALPRRRQRCGAYDDRRLASRTDETTCACASSSCDERSNVNANANASSFASCDLGWSDAYANGYASCPGCGCGCGSCCGSSSCSSASSCSSVASNACYFLVICACGARCGFDRPAWTDERPSDVPVTSVPFRLLSSYPCGQFALRGAWLGPGPASPAASSTRFHE